MYAYYGLSAIGPQMRPYLWWKRYITKLQLIQFVAILVYIISALYIDCGFSRNQLYLNGVYLVTLIVLFANFYIRSYLEKNKKSE